MPLPNDHDPVLLVEDNPNDVLLVRRAFGKSNLPNPLRVLGDGEKAVQYLAGEGEYADRSKHPLPLLVLLDLKLPRKGGAEVLQWLRGHPDPGVRRTLVVVLTASAERSDVDRCYDLGANSYLVKPVQFADLLALVELLARYWIASNVPPRSPA